MKWNNNFVSFLTNRDLKSDITECTDIKKMKLSVSVPAKKMGRVLLIEPHSDDLVLSMGGSILQLVKNGLDIVCLCVFSNGGQLEKARKDEGRYVWRELLGGRLLFGELTDYAYRKEKGIAEMHAYRECVSIVQRTMSEFKPDFLIGPMGIGEHMDHVLINNALVNVAKRNCAKIFFYEDFPYVNRDKYYYMKALNRVKSQYDISPLYNPITEQIGDKAKLNMVYQSQYQLVWEEVMDLFKNYGKAIRYEGIYMKKSLDLFGLYERLWFHTADYDNFSILFPNAVY